MYVLSYDLGAGKTACTSHHRHGHYWVDQMWLFSLSCSLQFKFVSVRLSLSALTLTLVASALIDKLINCYPHKKKKKLWTVDKTGVITDKVKIIGDKSKIYSRL